MTHGTRSYISEQWKAFVLGLKCLAGVSWMNDPMANAAAECKTIQLTAAVAAGLTVPETCITNDLGAAKRLGQPLIGKSLSSALIEEPDANYFIFTSEVDLGFARSEEVAIAPVIFQRKIWPKTDYRVTIVGSQLFSARLAGGARMPLDWRTCDSPPPFEPATLPEQLTNKLLVLMERLGLRFGAVDLCESDRGLYFLEINPNGEWGWLETTIGLPIADAITNELSRSY